jgi:cellulose synthase/poly-beta-1,6-N-acetylglucosamine synthase-like glycosyltransferase
VFLVPALNEGVTIADSVERLRAVKATNKIIIVINDGSEDDTGEVLKRIGGSDLEVLTRVAPNARKGKAAALNNAYFFLKDQILSTPRYRHWKTRQVIIGIVDADGRLDVDAPAEVSSHFDIPNVGGVQANVHIYNKSSFLTRMQELEFRVFGGLYQLGRSRWGSAFRGGNGQFNRMKALESVIEGDGPWSDFLTEDQELGLRLLARGWRGEHAETTFVDQQGLNDIKRLYRQRGRWMQGNLQVVSKARRLFSYNLVGLRRLDALVTLIMPILILIVGTAVVISLLLWIILRIPLIPMETPWLAFFFALLAIGPVSTGVLVLGRGRGVRGFFYAVKEFAPYLLYVWIMWPVAFLGLYNFLRKQKTWAKTAREAIVPTS